MGLLMRPLTAPRLHFKGAGWYVNDYPAKSFESATPSSGFSEPAETRAYRDKKLPPPS